MVVLKHGIGSKLVLIAKPVAWSRKSQYYQNYHSIPGLGNGQGNQKQIREAFASAAYSAYGTTGKTEYKGLSMPTVAVKVATGVRGRFPELHQQALAKKEAARATRHEATGAFLSGRRTIAAPAGF